MRLPVGKAAACVASAVSLVACVALAAPAASVASSQTTAQVLQSALQNATGRGSVHVAESREDAGRTAILTTDVSTNAGTQTVKLADVGTARVLVVGNTAYLSGNPGVLTGYFGLPKATAKAIGSRWVSIPSSSSSFATVGGALTLPSLLKSFTPALALALRTEKGSSGPVVTISGKPAGVKGSQLLTLYLSSSGSPLPVAADAIGGSASSSAVFSGWGEKVSVAPPSHAVPLASIKR